MLLTWLSEQTALDWLRVGGDNTEIVADIMAGIPREIEVRTGYPAKLLDSEECDPLAKQLVRFMLMEYFNPDGTDADRIHRVVDDLIQAVRVMYWTETPDA